MGTPTHKHTAGELLLFQLSAAPGLGKDHPSAFWENVFKYESKLPTISDM